MLAELDRTAPALHGIGGCDPGNFTCGDPNWRLKQLAYKGLCGGAGYVISRHNLNHMVGERDLGDWMAYWRSIESAIRAQTGASWSDLNAGCAAQRAGLQIMIPPRDRMHGWAFTDRDSLFDSLRHGGVTYHYVGEYGMPFMREMHELATSARAVQLQPEHTRSQFLPRVANESRDRWRNETAWFCRKMQLKHCIVPSSSWGTMPLWQHATWKRMDCDNAVKRYPESVCWAARGSAVQAGDAALWASESADV